MSNSPASAPSSSSSNPVLTPLEAAGLRAFVECYQAHYEPIMLAVYALSIDAGPNQTVNSAGQQQFISSRRQARELMAGAINDGDWAPYLESLMVQGQQLAQRGLTFQSFFLRLGAFRQAALPFVLADFAADPERLTSALTGLHIIGDLVMAAVGQGYLAAKEQLIHAQEEALHAGSERRQADDRFSRLMELAPDALVIVDETGRIVLVNSQMETLFGYTRVELIGANIDMVVPQRFRAHHPEHRAEYFRESRFRPMGIGLELFGVRKDGSEFPVEISLSPLETDEGRLVTAAIRDATERRRFEQTLRDKNIELEAAIQAKDRFLASMSHELRTPLNAIIGFTGTLLMRLPGPLTVDQEKQLRTVQSSARHLLSLINDLLDLVKIESGKVELNQEPVVCQGVIAEVMAALTPLAAAKGLHLIEPAPQADLTLHTDRRALHQILLNLTNNAIKFTDQGEVRLALSQRPGPHGPVTEISVSDTGIGIRAADQGRLFQAFEQVAGAEMRRREGTGLGLHVSQKLAGLLGGEIVCASEFGSGSTFRLVLGEA